MAANSLGMVGMQEGVVGAMPWQGPSAPHQSLGYHRITANLHGIYTYSSDPAVTLWGGHDIDVRTPGQKFKT